MDPAPAADVDQVSLHDSLTAIEVGPPAAAANGSDHPMRTATATAIERDALLRVAAAAAGASGLEDVLELAAEEALRAVGAASLSVSRWEEQAGAIRTLINVGDLGPGEERYPQDEVYSAAEHPQVEEMIASHRPYFNALDDAECDPRAADLLRRLGKSSDLGVPIVVEGRAWGEVWASKGIGEHPFRAEDISFLEAIAGQFAIAIARAELFSRVSRLAYEDALTGLPNRRALDERLERALGRAEASGIDVALLLGDLDELKRINDTRGHEAGDDALRHTAEALVAAVADRPGTLVARVSGDEYCVLLEGHNLSDAVAAGSEAIASLLAGSGLSLSCGAAAASATTRTPAELLKAADAALYAAKRRGGGQVCGARGVPEKSPARRKRRDAAAATDPLAAATDALIAELDERLADAPLLERLESVATAYTEAADLAGWTVALAGDGDILADVSFGDNRDRDLRGIRAGPGIEKYRLSRYPATEAIIRAGVGCFLAHGPDRHSDAKERELLERLGYSSVVAVAMSSGDGTYLVKLHGDRPNDRLDRLAAPLRLTVGAALPPRPLVGPGAGLARPSGAELSLAVAGRLAAAEHAEAAVEGTAEELQRAFGCHIVHVVRLDGACLRLSAESGRGRTAPGWTQKADAGLIGRCLREGAPVLAADVTREPQFRGTEATRAVRSELAVPVRVGDRTWGAINLEDTALDYFTSDDVGVVQAVAAQLAGALQAIELFASLERAYMGTAEALSAALEAKDPYTARHSTSIAMQAVAVGEHLGMSAEELRVLRYGAAFHDIGKLAVPQSILRKPGPLTDEERASVEQHTVIGERILSPVEFLAPVLPLVRHGHERWDGSGYPDGLAGEQIPLGARVLFACDALDAMTTDRPYGDAMPEQAAFAQLRDGAGSQFDPAVVEALLAVLAVR